MKPGQGHRRKQRGTLTIHGDDHPVRVATAWFVIRRFLHREPLRRGSPPRAAAGVYAWWWPAEAALDGVDEFLSLKLDGDRRIFDQLLAWDPHV
ncbi:hypothetical protein [Streptomyces sp. NPDC056255]|uniref:hypothetical protein n=1 Tax=Streptomyces sp. NPDC056255 TaxID=3345764 RepID=UPI0035D77F8B